MNEIMMVALDSAESAKDVARILRANLKFNNIRASVTTSVYAMGSTLNIDLKDDLLTNEEIKEIREFCRKFEDTRGCYPNRHVKVTVNGSQITAKR